MDTKRFEGIVFRPVPGPRFYIRKGDKERKPFVHEFMEPRCEMCGHEEVISSYCKRICLHCGFMTGRSESACQ